LPAPVPQPGKNAATFPSGQVEPQFIILGHASGVKGFALRLGGQLPEGVPSKGAADTGRGDRCAQRLAQHHLLAMQLGELIPIMAGNPARTLGATGDHRKLDKSGSADQVAEQGQGFGMNDILCIVENDRGKIGLFLDFVATQRIPEMIETIGLGGGSVSLADDQPNLAAASGCCRHRSDRLGIVGVAADIDSISLRFPLLQAAANHGANHRRFFPGRHEYRHAAFGCHRTQAFHGHSLIAGIYQQLASQTVKDPQPVKQQVVDRADQKGQAGEQQQFLLKQVESRQNLVACHGHTPQVCKSGASATV